MKYITLLSIIFCISCNKIKLSKKNTSSNVSVNCETETTNDDGFQSGTGTFSDPYTICTFEHLDNVRNFPNAYFKLESDLDLLDEDFEPIEELNKTFDGQGYIISNWTFSTSSQQIAFFVSTLPTTKIINLHFDNIQLTGGQTGGIVGELEGLVNGCSIKNGNLTGIFGIGGIVGGTKGSNAIIANSFYHGSLTATGDASLADPGAAGIIAMGGIVGIAAEKVSIQNSYSFITNITFDNSLGSPGHGACGSGLFCVGEVLGLGPEATISNVYYLNDSEVEDTFANYLGIPSLTLVEFNDENILSGFDFNNIWKMGSGDYPFPILDVSSSINLATEGFASSIPNCIASLFAGGSGEESDPFLIANKTHLASIPECDYESTYFKQTADINDLDPNFNILIAPKEYDGDGHVISPWSYTGDFDIDNDYSIQSFGFFAVIPEDSSVKNLTLNITNVTPNIINGTLLHLGGITGRHLPDSIIDNVVVNLTGNFREDTDNVKIGLLAGYSDGTITNSIVNISNTGSVRSDGASANVGGALGDYQDSSGVEVFSNIEVNIDGEVKAEGGGGRIGGVVAESFGPGCIMDNIDVTISGTGKVEANDTTGTSPFLGGMIGINTGIIRNSSLIIEPGGKVTTTGGIVAIGGMAGYNDYHIESTNTVLIQGSILGGPSSPIGGYVGFSYNSSVSDGQVTVAATGIIQASDGTRIGGMYGASSGTVRGQITNFGTIKATSGSPIMGGFIGTLLTGGVVQSGTMILSSSGRIETDYTGVTTSKIGGFAGHTETGSIISSGSSDLSGTIYDSTNSFGSIGGFIGFHEGLITMANLDLRLGGVILIDNGSGDYGWLIGLFNQTGGASYVHNLGVATGNLQVNTIPQNSTNLVGDTW